MNIFEQATRKSLRFQTKRGLVSTEDLWTLPLTSTTGVSLDDVAKSIHREQKTNDEVSFVEAKTETTNDNDLRMEIVKHIIAVRLQENNARNEAREAAEKRQRIMSLIQAKKDQALESLSIEELEKML